jgi:hypothetical protein
VFVAAAAAALAAGVAASGAETPDGTHVLVLREAAGTPRQALASLDGLGVTPGADGGVALLAHADRVDDVLRDAAADPDLAVTIRDGTIGDDAASMLELARDIGDADQTWVVGPGSAPGAADLGVVVIWGRSGPDDHGVRTLTSDSTRRDGVVVAEDLLPTMRSIAGLPAADGGGAVIRPVDAPVPVELLDRYVANRRMSVPIQTAAGLFVTAAGLLGAVLLAARDRVPPWLTSSGAWIAIAVVPLAVSLLFAGHLETLTYPSVLTVVIGGTVLGCAAAALVARRRGTVAALAALGVATIALFLLEAALGWTAALTTFLGGTELDGGRFYGLPNVDIGLLLGAGVFVAYRVGGIWPGVTIIGGLALFAGSPFAGANLGAAVTLGAGAGLWWGFQGRRSGWAIVAAAVAGAAAGGACTLLASVVLPGAPTHITSFVEGESGGVAATVLHRLRTGVDLIARNPFAILPVIGVPATLVAVLRPPVAVRASFERHPRWRQALLTILWGSVVAYLANDTGAAALGLGFGTALGGLLFVSLRDRPWMMGAS